MNVLKSVARTQRVIIVLDVGWTVILTQCLTACFLARRWIDH